MTSLFILSLILFRISFRMMPVIMMCIISVTISCLLDGNRQNPNVGHITYLSDTQHESEVSDDSNIFQRTSIGFAATSSLLDTRSIFCNVIVCHYISSIYLITDTVDNSKSHETGSF